MADLIDRQAALNMKFSEGYNADGVIFVPLREVTEWIKALPPAQQDFDLVEKMDKAYDDGYEAGYLQARHDWGNLDE